DVVMAITAHNRGPDAHRIHILPHLWFRNTWAWGAEAGPMPQLHALDAITPGPASGHTVAGACAVERSLGDWVFYVARPPGLVFTNNDSNAERLFGSRSRTPWVKDAFHRRVCGGELGAVNPEKRGTKLAAWCAFTVPPGGSARVLCRLSSEPQPDPFAGSDEL